MACGSGSGRCGRWVRTTSLLHYSRLSSFRAARKIPFNDGKQLTRWPRKSIPTKRCASPQGTIFPKKRSKKVVIDSLRDEQPPRRPKAAKATEKSAVLSALVDVQPVGPAEPKWSFIKPSSKKAAQFFANVAPPHRTPFIGRPRVWTHVGIVFHQMLYISHARFQSRADLLVIFPNLKKATSGLAWIDSETPILIIHDNYPQDTWSGPLTLNISMYVRFLSTPTVPGFKEISHRRLWSYLCDSSALRPLVSAVTEAVDNCARTLAQPREDVEARSSGDTPSHCSAEQSLAAIRAHNTPISCGGAQIPLCTPEQVITHAEPQQPETQVRSLVDTTYQQSCPNSCPSTSQAPDFPPYGVRQLMEPLLVIASNDTALHPPQLESATEPEEPVLMFPAASNVEVHDVGEGTAHSIASR